MRHPCIPCVSLAACLLAAPLSARAPELSGFPFLDLPASAPSLPAGEKLVMTLKAHVVVTDVEIGTVTFEPRGLSLVRGRAYLHSSNTVRITRFRPQTQVEEAYCDPATLALAQRECTNYNAQGQVTRRFRESIDQDAATSTLVVEGQPPATTHYPAGHEISSSFFLAMQLRTLSFTPGAAKRIVMVGENRPFTVRAAGASSYSGQPTDKLESTPSRFQGQVTRDAWRVPLWCKIVIFDEEDRTLTATLREHTLPPGDRGPR